MIENKNTIMTMISMIDHIKQVAESLDLKLINDFLNQIINTKRIFIMGAGRSGFEARAFGMRLIHLGFDAHVIGEVTTPALKPDDLVIAISNSGGTLANLGKIIKKIGAKLITITSERDSPLGKISDMVIIIPGDHVTPLGTIFEATTRIFLDGIVSELMIKMNKSEKEMEKMHMFSGYSGIL